MLASVKQRLVLFLAFLFTCLPGIALGDPDSVIIDCALGQTIQDVLGEKSPNRRLTVFIRGVCTEPVTIARDDVTLVGDGAKIAAGVTIDAARRAEIAGLTISNPVGDGITVTNGGSATIRDSHIDDNAGYGIFVRNDSFAMVNRNTMLRNGIVNPSNPDASGIAVSLGSMVRALQNQIGENLNTGIEVFDNATYRSEGDIVAMRSSPPQRSAVDTYRAAYVDLRGVTVNGRVFVDQQAQLQMRNLPGLQSTITGDIVVSTLSFLRLRTGVNAGASTLSCPTSTFSVCRCDGGAGGSCPVVGP
jgi:Right handed beta helix region